MSKVDVVTQIGDVLTQIDALLSDPDLSPTSSRWQQLFALRKHLDDQQRDLVRAILDDQDTSFQDLAKQLGAAAAALKKFGDDISKIGSILQTVGTIAGIMDKILNLAH
jgi:predicted transcriptional regulator